MLPCMMLLKQNCTFYNEFINFNTRFSDPDRSLNRKKKRFKVFEVEPKSNWGRIEVDP